MEFLVSTVGIPRVEAMGAVGIVRGRRLLLSIAVFSARGAAARVETDMASREGELSRLRDARELSARGGVGNQGVAAALGRTSIVHQAMVMNTREANHGVALSNTTSSGGRSRGSRLHLNAGTSSAGVSAMPHHGLVHELLPIGV